jgi:hypothetical protein
MLVSLLPNDLDWPLDDWQLALASVAFVAMLVLFIVVFKRSTASRAEFARLQEEAKQLSEDVKGLRVGEQRRFLQEIRAAKRCDTPTPKATSLRLPLCGHRFATSSLPSHSATSSVGLTYLKSSARLHRLRGPLSTAGNHGLGDPGVNVLLPPQRATRKTNDQGHGTKSQCR